jgi:hypothetical protein
VRKATRLAGRLALAAGWRYENAVE